MLEREGQVHKAVRRVERETRQVRTTQQLLARASLQGFQGVQKSASIRTSATWHIFRPKNGVTRGVMPNRGSVVGDKGYSVSVTFLLP